MTGLMRWRERWTGAGFPAIPLRRNGKEPLCDAWNVTAPADQWEEVGSAFRGNIGVVVGNGNAAIDCDSESTVRNVREGLSAMGLQLPEVETQSGGRHFYTRVVRVPARFNWCNLGAQVGPGELRARNAYLVTPCSAMDGRRWRFVRGSPEAIAGLRPVAWRDLQWLIAPQRAATLTLEAPPIRLVWREMPAKARLLLGASAETMGPVRPFAGYVSRSEAESAAVAMLILAGWSFELIGNLFEQMRPGHYRDTKARDHYLAETYRNALGALASTPDRQAIAEMYRDAQLAPWPGRGGGLERDVFLALLAVCWQCDGWVVRASVRCLAQHAAGSLRGVHNALGRLQRANLIHKAAGWQWDGDRQRAQAATWRLHKKETEVTGIEEKGLLQEASRHVHHGALSTYCALPEAFARGRLGRSAGAVYCHLVSEPLTVRELAEATGKHRNTISAALRRLEGCGLASREGRKWVRGDADLGEVADELGAEDSARWRRGQHERQREAFAYVVERRRWR